tara:strand:- start:6129 stop:8045 length:1917 start_codon:yes stop_codon:yes gene_type:complete
MNLVQLSEQLKDVPDSFLQNEVTNPTGAYPAYLVISELTRRKRMRDNVAKQEPGTTVAEDVMGLNAIPQAMQSLAAQDVAMAGPPQQMPMPPRPQPQQMAEGGLVAFDNGGAVFNELLMKGEQILIDDTDGREYIQVPNGPKIYKDGSLGIDIIGAGRQNELEEFQPPVKSQFQEFIGPKGEEVIEAGKIFGRGLLEAPGTLMDKTTEIFSTDPKEIKEAQESLAERLKRIQGKEEEGIKGVGTATFKDEAGKQRTFDEYSKSREAMRKRVASDPRNQKMIQDALIRQGLTPEQKGFPTFNLQKNAEKLGFDPYDPASTEEKEGNVGSDIDQRTGMQKQKQSYLKKMSTLDTSFTDQLAGIKQANKDILNIINKGKTGDEIYQEGVDKYKKEIKNPLRFLKDEIKKEEERIKKLKFDNLNDALIQAGAAILQSPGGQNLQWLGKGLEGFQKAYKEGREDIIDSKKDLLQSKIAYAESENNYSRGAEEAGLKNLQKAEMLEERSLRKSTTAKALFAEDINTNLEIAKTGADIEYTLQKADFYRRSDPNLRSSSATKLSSAEKAEIQKNVRVKMAIYANKMNLVPSDPRYIAEEERLLNEAYQKALLRNQGLSAPITDAPRTGTFGSIVKDPLAPTITTP